MKIQLGELRTLVREELEQPDDGVNKEARLEDIAKSRAPYLKGKWQKAPYQVGFRGSAWVADDPVLGTVYLRFESYTSYGHIRNSRLRDPAKTSHSYWAELGFDRMGGETFTVVSKRFRGEDNRREQAVRDQISKVMLRRFGVDPFSWTRSKPLEVEKPKPEPKPGEPKARRIYGRMKGAPAHTRLRGKAYLAGVDTEFANGDRAYLEPEDGKLRVRSADSDHSQLWEPE